MEESEAPAPPDVPVEKLVKVYLKMNAELGKLRTAYKADEEKLKGQMSKVKAALLAYCTSQKVDSVKTAEGLFYRTVSTNYWTNDWGSLHKFIIEHQAPELLHDRIHQGNMEQFLKDNPGVLPPGLNVETEYSITIRRK